ncbi:MAG: hypothetical protein VCC20_08600, partial [Myxococcota bacterium]
MDIELAVRVRECEPGLLNRDVGRLSFGQQAPRDERALEVLGRGVSPAGAQQRLIRERPREAHAIERALCRIELFGLEAQGAKI